MSGLMLLAIAAAVVVLVVARQKKLAREKKPGEPAPSLLDTLDLQAAGSVLKIKLSELAAELDRVQFDPLAELVEAIAEDDEAAAVAAARKITRAVRNRASLLQLFGPLFDHLLELKLLDNESREKIVKAVTATAKK